MPATSGPNKRVKEHDISAHLRGLVDGCFEEGQYEVGLNTLDQLRSSDYRPAASHIRQLVCIALRAPLPVKEENPPSPKKNKGKGVDYGLGTNDWPASLSQQKFTYLPSLEATEAARRILVSFALTNTPSSVFRALPSYPLDTDSAAIGGRIDGADLEYDGQDSYIARVAQCIGSAANVWAVIKPGFINWESPAANGATGKPKGRKNPRRIKEEPEEDFLVSDNESVVAVGEDAWPVLEWLVLIFDRDELQAVENGELCYSPLLLSAIPSTRSNDPRWDANTALDVVFYCLNETYEERNILGISLLRQLINLTCTTLFDLNLFVGVLYRRLPVEQWDTLGPFLANLPSSITTLQFKLHLCTRYLNEVSKSRGALPSRRAQPRAARRGAIDHTTRPQDTIDATRPIARTYPSISWSTTIEPLVSHTLGGHPNTFVYNKIKFELLSVYGTLQGHQIPVARDTAWKVSLNDGTFQDTIESVFDSASISEDDERKNTRLMGELLIDMIPSFQVAID